MISNYTAKYTKTGSGYMGQLVEWPEVITEGKTLDECRDMLKDALKEMVTAYRQQGKTIPITRHRTLDRTTANELCKQAGLEPKF
jgi:predicted RNase H-like HicB family nuclease